MTSVKIGNTKIDLVYYHSYESKKDDISDSTANSINTIGNLQNDEVDKKTLKNKLKANINTKFVVGDKYLLQSKNKKLNRIYICKKFVYSINDEALNIVIMKQISGIASSRRFAIGIEDCRKLHIKYESGLEVFSMNLNWKHLK